TIANISFNKQSTKIEKYINNTFIAENIAMFDNPPVNVKCIPSKKYWYSSMADFIIKYRGINNYSQYELCRIQTDHYLYEIYLKEDEQKHIFSLIKFEKYDVMQSRKLDE
ncbi:MAG: hypothetical protein RLZZ210_1676, partial [Pseudomonadota bacterium]